MHEMMLKWTSTRTRMALSWFGALCTSVVFATYFWYSEITVAVNQKSSVTMKTGIINQDRLKKESHSPSDKWLSCQKLIAGNASEISKTTELMKENFRISLLPESYSELTKDCQKYRRIRNYINMTMSEGERQFPIAFSLLVYKHVEQVERLLRAIWRPQNIYCIHVDGKSPYDFKRAMRSISKCFDNVFVLQRTLDVRWGTFSVLEPELLCMKALWKYKTKWKYFINLTGQEFPLKTNYELYRILESYNGANDIQGINKGANLNRWKNKGPVPHGIKPRKGSVHIAATRNFVDYILHNQTAIDLLKWVKRTSVPDETYFATLNHNPHLKVPGSYNGDADDGQHRPWTRYKIWYNHSKCKGKFVRAICVFSVGDLQRLTLAPQLFANKFLYDYHYLAYDCLESWYYGKVEKEKNGQLDFNTTSYIRRRIVKNHF